MQENTVKNKQTRLKNIKDLIRNNRVQSQEMLSNLLKDQGIVVTQATLSRDLKMLKVGKIYEGDSGYYYVLPENHSGDDTSQVYVQDFKRGFRSIDFSNNIAVIRTTVGYAETVGMSLDNLELPEVLGSVAGEDTVFVVMKEGVGKDQFLSSLRNKVPGLERK